MKSDLRKLNIEYVLNSIDKSTDLQLILNSICSWLESNITDALVTIMLYSEVEQTLTLVNGEHHFSSKYCRSISPLKVKDKNGSCGTAAFSRKTIISRNLILDPNWKNYLEFVREENIISCWSVPIISAKGILYGTFGTYYREEKTPRSEHFELINQAVSLIALAIERENEYKQRLAINEKYSSFYTHHPDLIIEIDLNGYILNSNITCNKILGFSEKQILGKHFWTFIPTKYHKLINLAFKDALKGIAKHYKIPAYHASGKLIWLDLTNLPIIQNQKVTGVFAIARDISTRLKNEESLRLLKRGVDASPNGIFITDISDKLEIVFVNPSFTSITGYSPEEILGKSYNFLSGPETDLIQVEKIKTGIKELKETTVKLKKYRRNGTWFWCRLMFGPVFDQNNICTHFLGNIEDITEDEKNRSYIKYQHTRDSITGLPNQRTFNKFLEKEFEQKNQSPASLALFYIDLDDFRSMNESLGYLIGDKIIRDIGSRLQDLLKKDGLLSRYIEDKFILLVKNSKNHNQLVTLAESILDLISQNFQIENKTLHLTASIGIAVRNSNTRYASELLYESMNALKEAKKQGRNTWYLYKRDPNKFFPEKDYALLRLELMTALKEKQFRLFYQPLVDPRTGKVHSVEALIRWHHPQKGFIFPDTFIPLAERTGQIVAIGQWVLEQACFDIAHINGKNNATISVSVNISPLQFGRSNFLSCLESVLIKSKLPANLLKIEITEGVIINGADRAIEILKSVRELGVKVSIDDFGTGYSSLSYLRRLPINQIKLDREFIDNLTNNSQDASIVQSIIHLAHQLNLEVVAEGVETLEQAKILHYQNCDLLQGYFYTKPVELNNLIFKYYSLEEC